MTYINIKQSKKKHSWLTSLASLIKEQFGLAIQVFNLAKQPGDFLNFETIDDFSVSGIPVGSHHHASVSVRHDDNNKAVVLWEIFGRLWLESCPHFLYGQTKASYFGRDNGINVW